MKIEVVPLMDICRPKQWPTISGDELTASGFPVFGANGKIGFYSEYNHAERTLLITCRGATCGTMNVCEPKSYVTGNAMALDDLKTDKIDMMYLFYYLRFRGFSDVISGSAQPQITRQGLEKITVPLLSLNRQKEIACRLTEIEKIITKRHQIIDALDEYTCSMFIEMFGDPITNPMGWSSFKLSDLALKITDGTHKTPKYQDSGIMFLSAKNVKNGELNEVDPKYISIEEHQELIKRCKPEIGDIVLTKSGSLGDSAIVTFDFEFSIFESLALIKPKPEVSSVYLWKYLSSNAVRSRLLKSTKGIAIRHLHLIDIRNLDVHLPPAELQNTFSKVIKDALNIRSRLISSKAELTNLYRSTLSESFRREA